MIKEIKKGEDKGLVTFIFKDFIIVNIIKFLMNNFLKSPFSFEHLRLYTRWKYVTKINKVYDELNNGDVIKISTDDQDLDKQRWLVKDKSYDTNEHRTRMKIRRIGDNPITIILGKYSLLGILKKSKTKINE